MRTVTGLLIVVCVGLQAILWTGRGGLGDVHQLRQAVAAEEARIARLKERNRSLAAEVMDLKQGLEAIEELARSEMGMVRKDEQFFRVIDAPAAGANAADAPPAR